LCEAGDDRERQRQSDEQKKWAPFGPVVVAPDKIWAPDSSPAMERWSLCRYTNDVQNNTPFYPSKNVITTFKVE
jgi:hypothetical protein